MVGTVREQVKESRRRKKLEKYVLKDEVKEHLVDFICKHSDNGSPSSSAGLWV